MTYEVGDKVKLKSLEQLVEEFDCEGSDIVVGKLIIVTDEMKQYLWKSYTIADKGRIPFVGKVRYKLEETDSDIFWLDEVIEKKVEDKPTFQDSFWNTVEQGERVLVGNNKDTMHNKRIVVAKLQDRQNPYIIVSDVDEYSYQRENSFINYLNCRYIKKIKDEETIEIDDKEYSKEDVKQRLNELEPIS